MTASACMNDVPLDVRGARMRNPQRNEREGVSTSDAKQAIAPRRHVSWARFPPEACQVEFSSNRLGGLRVDRAAGRWVRNPKWGGQHLA